MGNTLTAVRYQALYKPTQVLCGTGYTVVVTGWTVKQAIAQKLQPQEYAAIGQLYSPTRGISVLVRNLLVNPHVRHLVILNATKEDRNAGACQCLWDFFQRGATDGVSDSGQACWRIYSAIPGYIDREIPKEALERLRQGITCHWVDSISAALQTIRTLAELPPPLAWGDPQTFPMTEPTPTVLPGRRYGHVIEGKTIADTWVGIIQRVKSTGTIRPTAYGGQWQELIDLMAVVTAEPDEFYFPEPNYLPVSRDFLRDYVAQVVDDAPQREGVKYTYGQRLRSWFGRDQVQQAIHLLARDPDSARAVMSLWDVQDYEAGDSPPCLNHIWVRIVEDELSLTATFRSNDMFSAWPANAFGLRSLQRHIRDGIVAQTKTPLRLGALITISQSAHIYDDCWDNADRIIQMQYPRLCKQRDYADPIGSFVITVQAEGIVVEHMTPGSGEVLHCYQGSTATQLYRQIAADCPGIQADHALYLGTELQKAEIARMLPQQFTYHQDRPLCTRVTSQRTGNLG
jgi:thymidylate synthase